MLIRKISRIVLSSLLVIAPIIVNAVPIPANSAIASFSSSVDLNSMAVKFDLIFESAPNFYTIDSFGRQKDAFQLYVNSNNLPVEFNTFFRAAQGEVIRDDLTIVRGGEINVNSDIRVREVVANYDSSLDPTSGGWGPIVGSELFVLNDTELTLILPLSFLKDSDGLFYYYLQTLSFGGGTDDILFGISDFTYDVVSPVPESSSVALMFIGLVVVFIGWLKEIFQILIHSKVIARSTPD